MKSKVLLGAVGTAVGVIVILSAFIITQRNSLIRAEMVIDAQWAEVENQLLRRSDVMAGLVRATRGLMAHESSVIETIAEARSKLAGAGNPRDRIDASNRLEQAFSRFLVVVENYPNIKADQAFVRLMDEMAGTENRLAVARRNYNEHVNDFNIKLRVFPSSIFAGSMGMMPRPFFEVPKEAMERPDYDFGL